jgi:epoxyqueuosine reductase
MTELTNSIKSLAENLGFSAVGITDASILSEAQKDIRNFTRESRHGTMDWFSNTTEQRVNPKAFFPEAQSVIMVAYNYYRKNEKIQSSSRYGNISIYARGRDYHKILYKKLKKILTFILEKVPSARGKIFVDSFPVMEKPLAVRAGLGWIGKNSLLILKDQGSYHFLGGILLNIPLAIDMPYHQNFCGKCQKCLDACPTQALSTPNHIDARRCISYLTIEHRGEILYSLQKQIGNQIFGCDICQMICPWNKKYAKNTTEKDFLNRFPEKVLSLDKLNKINSTDYQKMFEGTPVRRAGFERFQRSVKIALHNSSNT